MHQYKFNNNAIYKQFVLKNVNTMVLIMLSPMATLKKLTYFATEQLEHIRQKRAVFRRRIEQRA